MRIVIYGKPIPKKRPRFSKRGKFVKVYSAQKKEEKATCIAIRNQAHFLEGALEVTATFYMPITKSTTKKNKALMMSGSIMHVKKPDVDNMVKFYLDCMNGIAFKDDSQVVKITAIKQYGEEPRTEIVLKERI